MAVGLVEDKLPNGRDPLPSGKDIAPGAVDRFLEDEARSAESTGEDLLFVGDEPAISEFGVALGEDIATLELD